MADADNPLSKLLMEDADSIDREKLANALAPFVRFDKTTKAITIIDSFRSLSSNELKIETILLASKARYMLMKEPDGVTPADLIKMDIMPAGSIKSTVKRLYDTKKIKKDTDGRYIIPNYRLIEVMEKLSTI